MLIQSDDSIYTVFSDLYLGERMGWGEVENVTNKAVILIQYHLTRYADSFVSAQLL